MKIKTIVAGAAIALAATIGSAAAAEQFTTIEGFEAEALTSIEMGEVRGATVFYINVLLPGREELMRSIGDSESFEGIYIAMNAVNVPEMKVYISQPGAN